MGLGTERAKEAISSNDDLVRKQIISRINALNKEEYKELLNRITRNVIALREKWNKDPYFFLTFHGNEGRDAINKVLKYMRMEPESFFGYADMRKVGAANRAFVRRFVDHFFPIVVNAIAFVAQKYDGFAYRITGDEIGLYLPSKLAPKEVDFIRLEIQATLDNFMAERFGFVKVEGIAVDDLEKVDKSNEILMFDGFSGLYRSSDGIFMVFDRHRFKTDDLQKDGYLAIQDANRGLSSMGIEIMLSTGTKVQKIPSIRASFGIVRACNKHGDTYINFINSKLHAQYILDIANKDKTLDLHGATAELLEEIDRFEEEIETASVEMLPSSEIIDIVNLYKDKKIYISPKHIETYYPVIKREYLLEIMQQLVYAEEGATVIVRGPPDSFYIAKKGKEFIFLTKCLFYYKPLGNLAEEVQTSIKNGLYTKDDLRESKTWPSWLGFKMISAFFTHDIGNSVILTLTKTVNQHLFPIGPPTDCELLKSLTDAISLKAEEKIESVDIKMILSEVVLETDNLKDPFSGPGREKIVRSLDDLEYVEYVDQGVDVFKTINGNLVKIYKRSSINSSAFDYARSGHRQKTRERYSKILEESYSEPALSKDDLKTWQQFKTKNVPAKDTPIFRHEVDISGGALTVAGTDEEYRVEFTYRIKEANGETLLNIGTRRFVLSDGYFGKDIAYEEFDGNRNLLNPAVAFFVYSLMETIEGELSIIWLKKFRQEFDLDRINIDALYVKIQHFYKQNPGKPSSKVTIMNIFYEDKLLQEVTTWQEGKHIRGRKPYVFFESKSDKFAPYFLRAKSGIHTSYYSLDFLSSVLACFDQDEPLPTIEDMPGVEDLFNYLGQATLKSFSLKKVRRTDDKGNLPSNLSILKAVSTHL